MPWTLILVRTIDKYPNVVERSTGNDVELKDSILTVISALDALYDTTLKTLVEYYSAESKAIAAELS